ncbi:MBL fold metallo-hydrolase RNA specificity domain-containing protein [Streptomyces parvus]|uniref:MBL fold metallo-hydrolase RNA specificity domain-containing protein n=1 Tax=Streptomyces parvus TaxID=66428 RepID=UPI00341E2391
MCGAPPPHTTYVVHGEPSASAALRTRITDELGWTAAPPRSSRARAGQVTCPSRAVLS